MKGRLVAAAILILLVSAGAAAPGGSKPATRMTDDLAALPDLHVTASAAGMRLDAATLGLPVADDLVTVDATAAGDPSVLAADLQALGARDVAIAGRLVSARVPISTLPALDTLASLQFVRPAYSQTSAGLVTSQGDVAIRADLARGTFGLDGSGVRVGVLSDSFGCTAGGAAADVASGDLTATVSSVAAGAGTPTGLVTFREGATTLGSATLSAS